MSKKGRSVCRFLSLNTITTAIPWQSWMTVMPTCYRSISTSDFSIFSLWITRLHMCSVTPHDLDYSYNTEAQRPVVFWFTDIWIYITVQTWCIFIKQPVSGCFLHQEKTVQIRDNELAVLWSDCLRDRSSMLVRPGLSFEHKWEAPSN